MHVKIKMTEISSDEEELVATLMLMKNLKKSWKGKAPFAWVRNLYKEREEKCIYHMLVREMKLGDRGTTSGELLN